MSCAFSIIITSYNHLSFLPQTIKMLENQSLQDFEIIWIDNNSQDGSVKWLNENKNLFSSLILNKENEGLCKAFNKGVALSKGKYLIDLSPDDVFVPQKLQQNFDLLENQKAHLLFSDCIIKNTNGEGYLHSERYFFDYRGKANHFIDILERHCLISPTMVVSRELYNLVQGYDESLTYEDFDFMTKASKLHDLVYDPDPLVIKQEVEGRFSTLFAKRNSLVHSSTLKVCKKLKPLCETKEEKSALKKRIWSETKTQIKLLNLGLVSKYFRLAVQLLP